MSGLRLRIFMRIHEVVVHCISGYPTCRPIACQNTSLTVTLSAIRHHENRGLTTTVSSFRFHKSLPMASVYFFFNRFDFLPEGLLVTSILSPIFYVWLLRKRKSFVLARFVLFFSPFALINYFDGGIDLRDYIVSFLLLLTVYVTVYAFAVRLHEMRSLDQLVRPLIWINFALACVGLVIRFTHWYAYMWVEQSKLVGGYGLIRYRMFTYEPSYYALLIAPLVLYAYWQFVQRRNWHNFRLLIAAVIPFLMAMSFGVTGVAISAILISHMVVSRDFRQAKWVIAAAILGTIGYIAQPATSGIKTRLGNIVVGDDSSANVRVIDSYVAAYSIASMRDLWFGVGVGQTKLYVQEFDTWGGQESGRLPCAAADTLATFGIVGLALRFLLEGFFFFKGKPYKDPFRFSLFIVVFAMQFGGSFLNNPAEYFAWVIALSGPPISYRLRRRFPARGSLSHANAQLA